MPGRWLRPRFGYRFREPGARCCRSCKADWIGSPMPTAPALESTSPEHDNLRGPDYYLMSPTTY